MTKILFESYPFLLGFDRLESLVEQTVKSSGDAYPPFNIEQSAPNNFRLSIAVAGFLDEELEILLNDNQLIIKGKKAVADKKVYLHHGIAARQFQKTFVLSDDINIVEATTKNGLLNIDLERFEQDSLVKKIPIRKGK